MVGCRTQVTEDQHGMGSMGHSHQAGHAGNDIPRQVTGRVGTVSDRDGRQDEIGFGYGPLRPPAKRRDPSGQQCGGRAMPGGWPGPGQVILHF